MPIRLIGDVHGKFSQYRRILKNSPPSIQVGDMGVGFLKWPHGDPYQNPPFDLMVKGSHRFIRGNHDNPSACRRHSRWIEDGHDENGIMFIGGALSVDRAWRIEGFDWWPDEELPVEALNILTDYYTELKPRIMITHDCPEEIAQEMGRRSLRIEKLDPRFASRTRQAFQSMWSAHSPELWVFGHWHHSADFTVNGTRFVCLAELEYRDDLITEG